MSTPAIYHSHCSQTNFSKAHQHYQHYSMDFCTQCYEHNNNNHLNYRFPPPLFPVSSNSQNIQKGSLANLNNKLISSPLCCQIKPEISCNTSPQKRGEACIILQTANRFNSSSCHHCQNNPVSKLNKHLHLQHHICDACSSSHKSNSQNFQSLDPLPFTSLNNNTNTHNSSTSNNTNKKNYLLHRRYNSHDFFLSPAYTPSPLSKHSPSLKSKKIKSNSVSHSSPIHRHRKANSHRLTPVSSAPLMSSSPYIHADQNDLHIIFEILALKERRVLEAKELLDASERELKEFKALYNPVLNGTATLATHLDKNPELIKSHNKNQGTLYSQHLLDCQDNVLKNDNNGNNNNSSITSHYSTFSSSSISSESTSDSILFSPSSAASTATTTSSFNTTPSLQSRPTFNNNSSPQHTLKSGQFSPSQVATESSCACSPSTITVPSPLPPINTSAFSNNNNSSSNIYISSPWYSSNPSTSFSAPLPFQYEYQYHPHNHHGSYDSSSPLHHGSTGSKPRLNSFSNDSSVFDNDNNMETKSFSKGNASHTTNVHRHHHTNTTGTATGLGFVSPITPSIPTFSSPIKYTRYNNNLRHSISNISDLQCSFVDDSLSTLEKNLDDIDDYDLGPNTNTNAIKSTPLPSIPDSISEDEEYDENSCSSSDTEGDGDTLNTLRPVHDVVGGPQHSNANNIHPSNTNIKICHKNSSGLFDPKHEVPSIDEQRTSEKHGSISSKQSSLQPLINSSIPSPSKQQRNPEDGSFLQNFSSFFKFLFDQEQQDSNDLSPADPSSSSISAFPSLHHHHNSESSITLSPKKQSIRKHREKHHDLRQLKLQQTLVFDQPNSSSSQKDNQYPEKFDRLKRRYSRRDNYHSKSFSSVSTSSYSSNSSCSVDSNSQAIFGIITPSQGGEPVTPTADDFFSSGSNDNSFYSSSSSSTSSYSGDNKSQRSSVVTSSVSSASLMSGFSPLSPTAKASPTLPSMPRQQRGFQRNSFIVQFLLNNTSGSSFDSNVTSKGSKLVAPAVDNAANNNITVSQDENIDTTFTSFDKFLDKEKEPNNAGTNLESSFIENDTLTNVSKTINAVNADNLLSPKMVFVEDDNKIKQTDELIIDDNNLKQEIFNKTQTEAVCDHHNESIEMSKSDSSTSYQSTSSSCSNGSECISSAPTSSTSSTFPNLSPTQSSNDNEYKSTLDPQYQSTFQASPSSSSSDFCQEIYSDDQKSLIKSNSDIENKSKTSTRPLSLSENLAKYSFKNVYEKGKSDSNMNQQDEDEEKENVIF